MTEQAIIIPQRLRKHPNDVESYQVSFSKVLSTGETLSTVDVSAATGLTADSASSNGAEFTVYDDEGVTSVETVAIGRGAEFRCSGGTAGNDYKVTIAVTTSNSRTLNRIVIVQVRS